MRTMGQEQVLLRKRKGMNIQRDVKHREKGLTKPWKENKSRKGWLTLPNATRDGRGNVPQLLAAETGK